jgi:hypothetical protein
MPDTMRSVLTQGARRLLDGEINTQEFEQGLILALAEAPYNLQKVEDLQWLAARLTSKS